MFFYLFLLFLTVPVIEIALIIKVSEIIGWQWTVAIIILTALLGSWLANRQGRKIFSTIKGELRDGRVPGDKIIEGVILLIGGFVLLFPGYITDFIGFMLLIPGNRRMIRGWLKKKFQNSITIRSGL